MKSGHLKSLTIGQRIGIIIVLTLFSIALHEFGHFIVYSLTGVPVHVSLQSVRPTGDVDASLDHWAKFAGPGVSWLAAITFLAIVAKNPGFAWTTAAFTNASIRLFPCVMDFVRAVRGRPPFSDEGDVALALTKSSPGPSQFDLVGDSRVCGTHSPRRTPVPVCRKTCTQERCRLLPELDCRNRSRDCR